MRIYEELYILKPDTPEEDVEASVELIRQIVTNAGGTIDKVDKWGVRRLAYRVQKLSEGFFVLVVFTTGPEAVKEIERRLRVSDNVVKYITVRIDEKLKWLEKRKKIREKRAARKPVPVLVPNPSVPLPVPAMPGAMPGEPAAATPAPATPPAPAPAAPAAPAAAVPEAAPTT
ncbi:MAG TPA: 30S ribosomal protein S6 [Bryobacteraceae bacterium]|nr:30S ribosomal protein S6 [Bryobacteraceae bacterium]